MLRKFHLEKFKKKNPNFIEKNNFLWTETKRDYTQFLSFLKDFIKDKIPENLEILDQIKKLKKEKMSSSELMTIMKGVFQITWNDPKEDLKGFKDSFRGEGIKFYGKDVFDEFMDRYELKYLIRAHEVFQQGFKFFYDKRLLSIFSSANYRGEAFPNPASYAIIRNKKIFAEIIK